MYQKIKIKTLAGGLLGISLVASLAAATMESPQRKQPVSATTDTPFQFAVISDLPYDEIQQATLDRAINPKLDAANFPFILHLGDFKTQTINCTAENDNLFKQWINARNTPVFYTPGDNEWADCDYQPLTAPVSELQRLQTIRNEFFRNKLNAPLLSVEQQDGQFENQSWVATNRNQNFVFGSLHVIGSRNGRYGIHQDDPNAVIREVEKRNSHNIVWLERIFYRAKREHASAVIIAEHGDLTGKNTNGKPCTANPDDLDCDPYFELKNKLAEMASQFAGPVLLMHGDTSPVCMEAAFHDTANLWRFNSTGDGALIDAAVIEVDPAANQPFTVHSLVWGLIPGACDG